MFMLQQKFDRGIVEFDRQLSLAREIDDKPEEADAYFGIGYGYLKRYAYDFAIDYLNKAQSRLAALGNVPKYSAALRALRECYDRLDKQVFLLPFTAIHPLSLSWTSSSPFCTSLILLLF